MGGALGNLYDRIAYGYVVDFLEIRLFRFAIFNLADCAISVGSALLILYLVLHWKELSSEDGQDEDEDENSPLPEEPCKKEGQEAFPAHVTPPPPTPGMAASCRRAPAPSPTPAGTPAPWTTPPQRTGSLWHERAHMGVGGRPEA